MSKKKKQGVLFWVQGSKKLESVGSNLDEALKNMKGRKKFKL